MHCCRTLKHALSPMCAAGLTNADQRITEDVEKFSFAIAELVRPFPSASLTHPSVSFYIQIT